MAAIENIFNETITAQVIKRINNLKANTPPQWGKMSVEQMLAHCAVTYDMVYTNKHQKPNAFTRFILKMFVKNIVVGPKPFSKNGKTSPQFLITNQREFDLEKNKLIEYINKTQKLGAHYFDNKASHAFGKLTKEEWNTMFYKHLDHHLTQFGV